MEIKFRAKNKNHNTWSFGSYVDGTTPVIVTNDNDKLIVEECIEGTVGQFTGLTTSSGFDYTGVPIYEGDIVMATHYWIPKQNTISSTNKIFPADFLLSVEYQEKEYELFQSQTIKYAYNKTIDRRNDFQQTYYFRNYVVERNPSDGGWRIRNKDVFHKLTNDVIYNRQITVIGNIYDNPELLTNYKDYDNKVKIKEKVYF